MAELSRAEVQRVHENFHDGERASIYFALPLVQRQRSRNVRSIPQDRCSHQSRYSRLDRRRDPHAILQDTEAYFLTTVGINIRPSQRSKWKYMKSNPATQLLDSRDVYSRDSHTFTPGTHSQERRLRKAISLGRSDTEYITRINAFALRLPVAEVRLGVHRFTSLWGKHDNSQYGRGERTRSANCVFGRGDITETIDNVGKDERSWKFNSCRNRANRAYSDRPARVPQIIPEVRGNVYKGQTRARESDVVLPRGCYRRDFREFSRGTRLA